MPIEKAIGLLGLADVMPYQEKSEEEYMNDAQMNHFRLILKAWRNQLRQEVDRTVHHMKEEAANFPDPVDRAAQEEEFSLELRARDRERKLIKKDRKNVETYRRRRFWFLRYVWHRNWYSPIRSTSNGRYVY